MIGKIMSVFVIAAIIAVLFLSMSKQQQMVVVYEGNVDKKPIEIKLNHFQDSDCGMVIDSIKYASQVVAPDGKTWFFHDHGGLAHWLENKEFKNDAVIWVYAIDVKDWIDGRKAWYSLNEETPMNYGFGAYKNKKEGFVGFDQMSIRMLRGETMANPYIRQQLLGK